MSQKNKKPIRHCGQNTKTHGNRVIVVNDQLELNPVLMNVYSGIRLNKGSFQVITSEGNLAFIIEWHRQTDGSIVKEKLIEYWTGSCWGTLDQIHHQDLWDKLFYKHPWAEEFLNPPIELGKRLPYLPRKVYGETIAEKLKREKLVQFSKRYRIDINRFFDALMNTPSGNLNFIPEENDRSIWTDYIPVHESFIHEEFYAFTDKQSIYLNKGEGKSIKIPKSAKILIRFTQTQRWVGLSIFKLIN